MLTVRQVSRITGVSVRTLHHYDHIGLLPPACIGENGYRYYDEDSLARLRSILLYRELEFPLTQIRELLDSPAYDRERALDQQIRLLEMRRERLSAIIAMAQQMKEKGEHDMSFDAFDREKIDRYAREAREAWGETAAWQEYEHKSQGRSGAENRQLGDGLMQVLAGFTPLMGEAPDADACLAQAQALQQYITEHFYTCTKPILLGLAQMYAAGGEMTENIDRACGAGTAAFAAAAIAVYCLGVGFV